MIEIRYSFEFMNKNKKLSIFFAKGTKISTERNI
jgi:hypothetical protein